MKKRGREGKGGSRNIDADSLKNKYNVRNSRLKNSR